VPELRPVYVIDDDEAVRESLTLLLESHALQVRTFASATEFLGVAPSVPPGCVLTDLRMPGMDGLQLLQRLLERNLRLPVIVMTGHGEEPLAIQALKAGAIDFIEKPFPGVALFDAVEAAFQAIDDTRQDDAAVREIARRFASLTKRECEVLEGVVAGKPNKIVAHELGISQRTVEYLRAGVMEKMHARSLSALVRMAIAAGQDEITDTG
jgi:two-component system, LuxR family, response regulator FixJ